MKTYLGITLRIIALVILSILVFTLILQITEKKTYDIRFGYFPDMALTPLFVAEERGFFKEENISVNLVSFGYQPQNIIPAIIAGEVDGGVVGTNRIISTISNDVKIKIVSSSSIQAHGVGSVLLVVHERSGIESTGDLKDKKIGLMLAGPEEYMIDKIIEENGFSEYDVTLIDVDFNQRIGAFKRGDLDAIFLQRTIYEKIKDEKTQILLTASDIIEDESVGALFFSEDFIENNPEKVSKFLRAWYRAHDFINENRDEATIILSNYTDEDPELYYDMIWPYFPSTLTVPNEKELNSLMNWMIEKGYLEKVIPYEDIVYQIDS